MNTLPQHQLQLEQFCRGKLLENGLEKSDFIITACSSGVNTREAERLFAAANFGSFNRLDLARLQHGYGFLQADPETYLLLHVRPGPRLSRGYVYPDYRCIVVPVEVVHQLAGNLQPLLTLLDSEPHLPELAVVNLALPKVPLSLESIADDQEHTLLQFLFEAFANKSEHLDQLLSMLIAERSVAIIDAPADLAWRLNLCQALLLVLPPPLRQRWTFATEVFGGDGCLARLKFLYRDPYARPGGNDDQYRWQTGEFSPKIKSLHPYVHRVKHLWTQGAHWLTITLHDESVTEVVERLSQCHLKEILEIVAYRLMLPTDLHGDSHSDWQVVEQLVTSQLKIVTTYKLSPHTTDWLVTDSLSSLHKAASVGFGTEAYAFLNDPIAMSALDRQSWQSTLASISLEYLKQQPEESNLLCFLEQVQQTQGALSNEFWGKLIDALRPNCETSEQVVWQTLALWLTYETASDYREFLLDANATAKFPAELAALRHSFGLPSTTQAQAVSLVTLSQKLPPNSARFFLDMLQEAITRQAFSLVDNAVLRHLVELTQQPEHRDSALSLVEQLLDARDQLSSEVLLELPRLLLTSGQIDPAIELLEHLAEMPDAKELIPLLVGNLCRTINFADPFRFVEKLEQSAALRDAMPQAYLGILQRAQWRDDSRLTIEMIDRLKRVCDAYTESVLASQDDWAKKGRLLESLKDTEAVASVSTLLLQIAETINRYARTKLEPAKILVVQKEFAIHCPTLAQQSRLEMLALLVDTFGSHQPQNITNTVATTVRLLKSIEFVAESWRDYAAELGRQMDTLSVKEQADFVRNCNYLVALLNGQTAQSSDPVHALSKLLDVVWQQMRPTGKNNEPSEKNWLKKLGLK